MCDNQGSIAFAKNPTSHDKLKHINVQHQFMWEKIENKVAELKCYPLEYIVVDIVTKALAKDRHGMLIEMIVQCHLTKWEYWKIMLGCISDMSHIGCQHWS